MFDLTVPGIPYAKKLLEYLGNDYAIGSAHDAPVICRTVNDVYSVEVAADMEYKGFNKPVFVRVRVHTPFACDYATEYVHGFLSLHSIKTILDLFVWKYKPLGLEYISCDGAAYEKLKQQQHMANATTAPDYRS